MKTIFKLLIGGALIFGSLPASRAEKLVILHTNDTHSQIDPFVDDDLGGVVRRKVVIDSVKAVNPNTLLIDLGDVVQGSLFFNIYKGELEEKLMNALGYDLRILGNHEFDNGLKALADNLKVAEAELITSNYNMRGTPAEGLFKPYAIREVDGKRIGFMGINLQPEGMIAPYTCQGMGYHDQDQAAKGMAWYLKNVENCDYVIALTHIGYEDDVKIAQASTVLDLVIGGHSHTLVNPADSNSEPWLIENANGRLIPVTQTAKGARYVGQITIDLDSLENLPNYEVIRVDKRLDSRSDGTIEEIIAPYRASVDSINHNILTYAPHDIAQDSPELLNFMADVAMIRGKQMAENVDLAIINKGGIRRGLLKGDVSEGDLITLMPFFNRYEVIEVPGDSLIANFDIMARQGGQGVSSNVEAVYDKTAGKCLSVKINGKSIDPAKTYRLVTIDYLANGGDYMHPLVGTPVIARSETIVYEDLIDYFRTGAGKGKPIKASEKPRMKSKN
ncbi:MAG: bifunctional metallophosphatase/5'-nucleotidase [Bacteroidales bacterium]|nr:bifunctional metallophosphatase/5'-nucleotidase [Bacteroidales bacterium]